MDKGKGAMDCVEDHHMEEEEGKCLINNPSQDHLSLMRASRNQVNEVDKDIIVEVSEVYKPVTVLSRRVVAQRARREREKECSDQIIKLANNAWGLAQRARREREKECNDQKIKLVNNARGLAQCARRERERNQCNSKDGSTPNVEPPSNFQHQKPGESPIRLHNMRQKQTSSLQLNQCNSKNVPSPKVEPPSNFHHQQPGKSSTKLHTMIQKQPSSSQPNQQSASRNPPWLLPQQSPALAQSPMQKFDTSAVMNHISVMLAAKKRNPVMEASIYKGCGTTAVFSSRSSKATLSTQKKNNKSENPPRSSVLTNGVLTTSASSTPEQNTAAAATANAPAPIIASGRNASAVVLGPGSGHGVLDTSAFAAGSSPTKCSSPREKLLIRRPSLSLSKTGVGNGTSNFSTIEGKATLPTQKKDTSSLERVKEMSLQNNKSETPPGTSFSTNGVSSTSASSTPERNRDTAVTNAPTPIIASGRNSGSGHGVLDTSAFSIGPSPAKCSNPREKLLIRRPSLSLPKTGVGSSRFSMVEGKSNQSLSSVPLSSGCAVPSPSSLVAAPVAPDLAKGDTSGSDGRIETCGVMQPMLSPVNNRVLLPQVSELRDTIDLTELNNVGKPADLGGGVFSICEGPGEQWRRARDFSRTKMNAVHQVTDSKFSKYRQADPDSVLPNSDKQEPKEITLRALKNDDSLMVPKPFISKDRGPFVAASMASHIMIPATESSQGSICPIKRCADGHLVYTRKKFKQKALLQNSNYEKDTSIGCTQQDHQEQQSSQQQAQSEGTKKSYFTTVAPITLTSPMMSEGGSSPFIVKPLDELQPGEVNLPTNSVSLSHPSSSQGMNEQHWRARFLWLETKLRNCDHSSHEEYIQVLQRLPSVDHKEHIMAMERRAIKLLVEEGHELLMMKHLNVLGKPASIVQIPTEK